MRNEIDNGDNVLVRFHHLLGQTSRAYLLAMSDEDVMGVWVPRSQIVTIDLDTNETWLPLWLAEKKGFEYE